MTSKKTSFDPTTMTPANGYTGDYIDWMTDPIVEAAVEMVAGSDDGILGLDAIMSYLDGEKQMFVDPNLTTAEHGWESLYITLVKMAADPRLRLVTDYQSPHSRHVDPIAFEATRGE